MRRIFSAEALVQESMRTRTLRPTDHESVRKQFSGEEENPSVPGWVASELRLWCRFRGGG